MVASPDATTSGKSTPDRGRRALLQAAAAALAGAAGAGLLQPNPTSATVDFMKFGTTNDAGSAGTTLRASDLDGDDAFTVIATGKAGLRYGISAVLRDTPTSDSGLRIYAGSFTAQANAGFGTEVVGVQGEASTEKTDATIVAGVRGVAGAGGATAAPGVGVEGVNIRKSGTGVRGVADAGTGVQAVSATGTALDVQGASNFAGNATFNAQVITSGPGSKFVGNGLGLSALNASFLIAGTVPDARLSANVPLKDAASNAFAGALSAASLAGNGAAIIGLDAANVTSGRLATSRLPRNVALRTSKVTPFAGVVSAAQFRGRRGKPAAFSSVGQANVAAGRSVVTVKAGGVGAKAHVLALLQSSAGKGVSVEHVEKVTGGFRAVLTGPATRTATLAFFVVAQP